MVWRFTRRATMCVPVVSPTYLRSTLAPRGGVVESLGTLFTAAAWGVPLVSLLGGVLAVAAGTRWRRRAIGALERAEAEQS